MAGNVTIEVVGRRPEHKPYLWIGRDGKYIGSIGDARQMRQLAKAIDRALNLDAKQVA